ncbi:MAG TPA: hypothetical protein VGC41_02435, partial [Kofleriaceae bacterium]
MKFLNVIAGLRFVTLTGAGAFAQPAPPPAPLATRDVVRDGTVEHVLLSPRGDCDGVVLRDDTVVRFPPHAVLAAVQLRPGSTIHVTGAEARTSDGTTIFDARV